MNTTAAPDVRLEKVVKRFDDTAAVDGVSVDVPRGSFFALLGPSGCGKTTTLRMIGGFEEPTEGRILLGDRDVVGLPPYKRDVNTVFQSYALFPHMTVADNVAFGLERRKVAKGEIQGRVREILDLVGLGQFGNRKPRQLSGGQQQRVALARALVNHPRVLLLDEPLGALDLKLRKQMQLELKRIQSEVGITFVHVTHDQEEAMTMADTIAVMNLGRIEQLGPPQELYERPATAFVAGFLGASNLLPGTVEGSDGVRLEDGTLVRANVSGRSGPVSAGVRPEKITIGTGGGANELTGTVAETAYIGVATEIVVETPLGVVHVFAQNIDSGGGIPAPRSPVTLTWSPDATFVVDRDDLCGPKEGPMNPRMTRNQLVRRGAAGLTVLSLPSLLAACGGGGGGDSEGGGKLNDVLNFSNWELYVDTPSTRKAAGLTGPTTLEQFTEKTGIKVNYYEDINSNSEYFATIQGRLAQGQGIGRDILVSTDNDKFLGQYLDNDWALKLDKNLIPNIANLIDAQASPPFDPNREFTLPWFSGMDGIAWNEDITGPVTTVTQLLEDPKFKGKVGVWNSMGDTLGLVMLENGDDPAKVTDETFDRALAVIQKAQDAGQIRRFYGNDYAQPLAKGDLAASMAWSGDILNLGDPKIKWGIPEKGGIIWTDNMLIPLGGSVPTASTYMNFVYDPKIAAQLSLGANYISSVKGVKEEAAKLNPDAAANTLAFPTDEMLSQMQQNDPAMFTNADYEKRWLAVQGK